MKREAFEKYKKAYGTYLSPVAYSNGKTQIENIDAALKQIEFENAIFKTRIDNLQKTTLELESRLEEYGGMINTWLEWNENFTEEEKVAIRKKLGLRDLYCWEREAIKQGKAMEQEKKKQEEKLRK